jgi:rod shape-determining protein MreD
MKLFLLFFPLSSVLLVLQTTLWAIFLPQIPSPNTTLLVTLYLGFQAPILSGALCALALGLLLDVFSGVTFGFHGIILLLIFIFTTVFGRQLNGDNSLVLPLATVIGSVAFAFISVLILLLFSDRDQVWFRVLSTIPLQIGINLIFVILLRPLFSYLGRLGGVQPVNPLRRIS